MSSNRPAPPQVPAIYRRRIGDALLTVVSDGYIDVANDLWLTENRDLIAQAKQSAHLPYADFFRNGINAYAIEAGGQVTLVDTGSGGILPTAGHFRTHLEVSGIKAADIATVFITHVHPDHVGGLVNDGKAAFPNARLIVHQADVAYWTSAAEQAKAPEDIRGWFDVARSSLAAYGDRVEEFDGARDLGNGISALPLPGHTPGHCGVMIDGGSERALIIGDACNSAALQMPQPDVGLGFDMDVDQTRVTRRELLNRAADEGLLITGTHLPFPSLGYVVRDGDAFRWQPEEWRYLLD